VLLLDEPLGALDLKLRKQMQVELKRIQQEVGITFIYVTHDQEEAMTMSDRIAVMNRGHYEQLGDPEILYERPTTRFVAGFLGVSNLLRATIVGTDGTYAQARLGNDVAIRIPGSLVDGHSTVSIGVRPEKIRLSEPSGDAPAGHNRLTGVVRDASYLGVSTPVPGRVARRDPDRLRTERRTRDARGAVARGDEVQLTWSPDHSFVVPETGDDDSIDPGAGTPAATTGA